MSLLTVFQCFVLAIIQWSSVQPWPALYVSTAPRGLHYGPVGVSLNPLRGERGGRWFSIRSSLPLLLALWGSLTGLIIQGDLPGRLTTQWADQREAFTSTISWPLSLFNKPPTPPIYPPLLPPIFAFLPIFLANCLPSALLIEDRIEQLHSS